MNWLGVSLQMLKKRGRSYHVRAYVPADLRQLVRRSEVGRTMGTVDFREAKHRAALWQGELSKLWQQLRRRGSNMERDQIESLVDRYLQARLDEAESMVLLPIGDDEVGEDGVHYGRDVWADKLIEQIEAVELAIRLNRFGTVEALAQELLGGTHDATSFPFTLLCRRLLEAQREALLAELQALQGQPLARRSGTAGAPVPKAAAPKASPMLTEVIAGYDRETVARWKPRSAQMGREGLAFFLQTVGDKPIGEVTPVELREYRMALRARPGKGGGGLSASSITKHQSYVTGLFKWAHDGELIDNNPAPRVLKPEKSTVADDEQRDAFSDGDLQVIFGGDYESWKASTPERYWLPLLMLYLGCRNEEGAQLHLADVREVDGVWCVDINADTPDKSLKNKFSKRLTPIHPALVKRGFLEHVDAMRAAGEQRVWPNLTRSLRGYNAPVSHWFNRRLEKLGVKTKRKDSYSLRHTFSSKMKEEGVPEYIIDQLTGHKTEGQSGGRYGKKVPLGPLVDALGKLQVAL